MGSRRKARIIAFQAIFGWEFGRQDKPCLLEFPWLDADKRAHIEDDTFAFARLIVAGTLENIDEIDECIKEKLQRWDFSRLAKVDLAILRMSVFSLIYQSDIPHSVTIDEAIDIAKLYGTDESYRFVNGVLDAIRKTRSGV
jgi:N utilization substance protein B